MKNALAAGFTALALRLWLIFQFPIVFGGDSMLRLMHRDEVLLSYQLPLLQCFIWALSRFTTGALPVRIMMAVIGALAAVAFYYLAAELAGPRAALAGAILFATNPFITPVSIVPYQEILLLATIFAAFYFAVARTFSLPCPDSSGHSFQHATQKECPDESGHGRLKARATRNWIAAAIFLGLACFTRFEAWVACPVLAAAWFIDGPRTLRRAVLAAALFGTAPILWIAARHGLSPQGSFV